jgi:hypothetical protein
MNVSGSVLANYWRKHPAADKTEKIGPLVLPDTTLAAGAVKA